MRILFLGTHGQKNWGDELLLRTFIKRLAPLSKTIYVNSYAPQETKEYLSEYDVDVKVFDTKKSKIKLLYYLVRSDALVFGGGSVLKELYVSYGGERYATLNVIDTLTRVAKKLGKPIYFCNIGVGPVETKHGLELTEKIVNRASYTTVRDSESLAILDTLNIESEYELKSDAVFSVSRQELGLPQQKKLEKSSGITIGVNLCRNIENNENWPYFIQQLAEDLTAWCKTNPNTRIVGIPMQHGVSNNNDAAELEALGDMIRKQNPNVIFDTIKPNSIEAIASAIDSVDVMVAERLHTLILSTIIGTPIVALEYDIKVTGIVKDIGLSNYGLNINKRFKKSSILALIKKTATQDKTVYNDLDKAHQGASSKSLESFESLTNKLKNLRKNH